MSTSTTIFSGREWNLFARVLQEILAEHGCGLGHLDDRAGIHPEKVRRLQRSLKVPKSFPVLNIYEMEQVTSAFQLNWEESLRLRAALLATSIEETLMDRINQHDALRAAEQILPIIEQALREHTDEEVGIGVVKGSGSMSVPEESEIDRVLGGALDLIDHATLALHLCSYADSQTERIERAQQAQSGFEKALKQLEKADPALKTSEVWRMWYGEARSGLSLAQERLALLGV
jgi:hypothetical protein